MRYYPRKGLRRKLYQPANRMMGTVCKKTFSSAPCLTTLAALGLGLTFFLSYKPGLFHSAKKGPSYPKQHSSSEEKTYFDAAPRSVSGRHPSYQNFAGIDNNGLAKKSGQFAVGSAALLAIVYFLGRNK